MKFIEVTLENDQKYFISTYDIKWFTQVKTLCKVAMKSCGSTWWVKENAEQIHRLISEAK